MRVPMRLTADNRWCGLLLGACAGIVFVLMSVLLLWWSFLSMSGYGSVPFGVNSIIFFSLSFGAPGLVAGTFAGLGIRIMGFRPNMMVHAMLVGVGCVVVDAVCVLLLYRDLQKSTRAAALGVLGTCLAFSTVVAWLVATTPTGFGLGPEVGDGMMWVLGIPVGWAVYSIGRGALVYMVIVPGVLAHLRSIAKSRDVA